MNNAATIETFETALLRLAGAPAHVIAASLITPEQAAEFAAANAAEAPPAPVARPVRRPEPRCEASDNDARELNYALTGRYE